MANPKNNIAETTRDILEKQAEKRIYRPTEDDLDSSNPPRGGSGLPSIPPGSNNQNQPQNQPSNSTPEKDK